MTTIDASKLSCRELNENLRQCSDSVVLARRCHGQRYIGCARREGLIEIEGMPGNALGAYLDGASITVHGNAQDACGDTMNAGEITVHGRCGDAVGYSMRGGRIFVRDDVGCRAGAHMKAYLEKQPALIIGGRASCFLGEYQAGGTIIVLGLNQRGRCPVDSFCGVGMHGGSIYLRCELPPLGLPGQLSVDCASECDLEAISSLLEGFRARFCPDEDLLSLPFWKLAPNSSSPYRHMYTHI
ncbi:MAG: glutamate synthase [Oscillospiraceae bacterium]